MDSAQSPVSIETGTALVKRVVQLSLELENCEMDARAYRVPLHFSLHGHLLLHHHLLFHHHFLLSHGLAFCFESAGVGTLRRRQLARFGGPEIGIGRTAVPPGTSRRGRGSAARGPGPGRAWDVEVAVNQYRATTGPPKR